MSPKPVMSQEDLSSSEVGNTKVNSFPVFSDPELQSDNVSDGSFTVGLTVGIINGDGSG